MPQLTLAHRHRLTRPGVRQHRPAQQADRIAKGCQRIAQLVREHRQELVLAAVGLLKGAGRLLACKGGLMQAFAGRLQCLVH